MQNNPEYRLLQPKNVIQLGPVKKQSVRPPDPAEPTVGARPAGPGDSPDEMLAPYPDGVLLRCSPKPEAKHGEYLVHDGAGQIVAGCKNKNVASLFCAAVHMYIRQANALAQTVPPGVAAALDAHTKAAAAVPVCEELDSPLPEEGK